MERIKYNLVFLVFILTAFWPFNSFAQGDCNLQCGVYGNAIVFCNPLKFCSVESFLTNFFFYIQGIIATLAIIFVVIGGIMYITSAGKEYQLLRAKKIITSSLLGFAISISAPSFLREISIILGWTPNNNIPKEGLSLMQIMLNVLSFLLSILGILALIMLVVGALTYMTSGGDEDRAQKAKKIILYTIVGIVVSLSALIVVKQIAFFFS